MSACLLVAALISACGGATTAQDATTEPAAFELTDSRPSMALAAGGKMTWGGRDERSERSPVQEPTRTSSKGSGAASELACGSDIGGWTNPVPTRADGGIALRNAAQPGSRIHYISSAQGNDRTGDIYFWDGSRIVDSSGSATDANGVAYGTDPMNPSVAVKPFKRWAYVGPRRDPKSDIGTPGALGSAFAAFRSGFPDWWLFHRGETFDLKADLTSFAQETNPAATGDGALTLSGGRSASERQVMGAYGDVCRPRPRFVHPTGGFVTRFFRAGDPTVFRNVAYLSLHFDGHDQPGLGTVAGITLLGQTPASTDILFEDVWVDGVPSNIRGGAQVTLRRSLITDAFRTDGGHVEGIFYSGTREGILRIEESILLRNGFSFADPRNAAWPPTGSQIWDMFNRNLYISGETDPNRSGMFDSVSMIGASGDQFRPGGRVERNFFYQGYVGIGAQGGYPDADGPTGAVVDNVIQRFVGTGTNDNRGHPGWGLQIGGGAYAMEVAGNIVTDAQATAHHSGLQFTPILQSCGVQFKYATRSNRVHDNVFDSSKAGAAVNVTDGVGPYGACFNWTFRGVSGNQVYDNVLLNSNGRESEYKPVGEAVGTQANDVFSRNRVFADRSSAASALGWTDAHRTLKTYLQSRGVAVTSTDGFPEYFVEATKQRRGQWRSDWTAKEILNYFRSGYSMSPLP